MMPPALKSRLQTRRYLHVFLRFVDRRNGFAQRGIRREIERYGDGRKLTLVVNGERLGRLLKVRESAKRHGTAGGRTCNACGVCSPARRRGGARRKRVPRRSHGICRRSVQ